MGSDPTIGGTFLSPRSQSGSDPATKERRKVNDFLL